MGEGAVRKRRVHAMGFGAHLLEGGVRFRLWAPDHDKIALRLEGQDTPLPMRPQVDGWHELVTDRAGVGSRYRFQLPDGLCVPDPASRFQPDDVHGPSEVIDPSAYSWHCAEWRGRPWEEAVLYELHIGTFTPEGTFRAAIERLDHLVALGVTALEIMPVADFPGGRNWGYDGVLPFAPDSAYGRPEDFKALVDAAHARGLMVLLDVVYNHFGPEGNYLPLYARPFFTDRHKTPWGDAVNVDAAGSDVVRRFIVDNALYWIDEFNLDGLRLDAVHAILDDGPVHLLEELAKRLRAAAAAEGRHLHLILENEENEAERLGANRFTAQWNDDVHHGLHVAVTGEDAGYYGDYAGRLDLLGRALAQGFAFQGEVMPYRGSPRGQASAHLPPSRFVAFLQNHDQIGNRAFGDRITANADSATVRAAACLYLLAPQVPMLFMGEEWGATTPFAFFCDFGPALADAVRDGRRREFSRFPEFQDEAARARIPDPTDPATFQASKLDWAELAHSLHAGWLDWYRRVLAIRRWELLPLLPEIGGGAGTYALVGQSGLTVAWELAGGGRLRVCANLGPGSVTGFPTPVSRLLWAEGEGEGDRLGPWAVRWTVEEDG